MAFLDVSLWDVSCDLPLGSGNQSLELAQASQLMSVRSAHPPEAQAEILNIFDAAVTKNPRLANRLAPLGKPIGASSGQAWATTVFPTLMLGVQAPFQPQLSPIDQVQTLISMAAQKVQSIMTGDNMGTPTDVAGLSAVIKYCQQLVALLAQDKSQASVVKNMETALAKISNVVRSFGQRQQQAGLSANGKQAVKDSINIAFKDLEPDTKNAVLQSIGLPPSQMPPIDPKVVKAAGQMQIAAAKHNQKSQQDAELFHMEQLRENARTGQELAGEQAKQKVKLTAEMAKIFLKHAAGNKEMAREKARSEGYEV
jgi:hypothetical protein